MRKKIAIFIGEISGDFQHTITKVITEKANPFPWRLLER